MRMRSAPRLLATTLPLLGVLLLPACGDIQGADDRQFYVKPPLDDPGLTIEAEQPTAMDDLGDPREVVPQTEATFIAPARPAAPAQQPQGAQPAPAQGAQPATPPPGG